MLTPGAGARERYGVRSGRLAVPRDTVRLTAIRMTPGSFRRPPFHCSKEVRILEEAAQRPNPVNTDLLRSKRL